MATPLPSWSPPQERRSSPQGHSGPLPIGSIARPLPFLDLALPGVAPIAHCLLFCTAVQCSAAQRSAKQSKACCARHTHSLSHSHTHTPTPSWFGLSLPLLLSPPLCPLLSLSQPPSPIFNGWSLHCPWALVVDDSP